MADLIRDRYETIEVVGRGGQGEVVRARDTRHDRLVSIKIRAVPEGVLDAVTSEARMLLSLEPHPNLPMMREDFFEGGRYHIVSDWVEGTPLDRVLAHKGDPGMPASAVLGWLGQVAAAIEHVHAHKPPIVHGDIKPANLILTPDGKVVIVDFGIARTAGAVHTAGTRGFIAPEIAAGGEATSAADIYALAATAFTLLTGDAPAGLRPTWEGVDPEGAGVIERALRRALATDPARRPARATELVAQLRAWLATELPSGVVTFLATEVEGATALWERAPEATARAMARHDAILADAVERSGGRLVQARAAGDATLSVFADAAVAVGVALTVQRALAAEKWPQDAALLVRSALHSGDVEPHEGAYAGPIPSRAAAIRSAAHGGQLLLSMATAALVSDTLPEGATLKDLGMHRLADLTRPERLSQIVHADLPSDFPPPRSLDAMPNNLPVQLTSFIGRDDEIAELTKALGASRLVTLTGAGGVGKTRLALHVAADLLDQFRDGVWFAPLAALRDPELVAQQVAQVFDLREEPGRSYLDTLVDYARAKEMLLVLDNCEHLVEPCAQLGAALLGAGSGLRVIATSREPLDIVGEQVWRVPTLPTPDPDRLPPLEVLAAYESVRLFCDRASLARAAFALDAQNAEPIARICRRLDGIPLAIELAAARVKSLAPTEIAGRLDQRFSLLAGGRRGDLAHHQTLRATIDWSHDLLSEDERILFRRLSVFVGGFTLDAAEEVCGDGLTSAT